MPSGCARASAVTSARVSQGNTGRDADDEALFVLGLGGRSLIGLRIVVGLPTFEAPPGEPSSAKKSALYCV